MAKRAIWRRRMGVEPTNRRANDDSPVLKTGPITGPAAPPWGTVTPAQRVPPAPTAHGSGRPLAPRPPGNARKVYRTGHPADAPPGERCGLYPPYSSPTLGLTWGRHTPHAGFTSAVLEMGSAVPRPGRARRPAAWCSAGAHARGRDGRRRPHQRTPGPRRRGEAFSRRSRSPRHPDAPGPAAPSGPAPATGWTGSTRG